MDGKKTKHESYGMLAISRTTGSARTLFGSSLKHNNTISIEVHHAEHERHLNGDWYHGYKSIMRVEMSPTQFTDAITGMNTSGVPVTIKYLHGVRIDQPELENTKEQFEKEFKHDVNTILGDTTKALKMAEGKLTAKGTITMATRKELADMLYKIEQDIRDNLPFVEKQFKKQMDKTITEAKGEVEAFFTSRIHALGSEKLVKELEKNGLQVPQLK